MAKVKTDRELVEYLNDAIPGLSVVSSELDYNDEETRCLTYNRLQTVFDDLIADNSDQYYTVKVDNTYLTLMQTSSSSGDDASTGGQSLFSGDFSATISSHPVWWVAKIKDHTGSISFSFSGVITDSDIYGDTAAWTYGAYYASPSFSTTGSSSFGVTMNSSSYNSAYVYVWYSNSEIDTDSDPDYIGQVEVDETGDNYAATIKWPSYGYSYLAVELLGINV